MFVEEIMLPTCLGLSYVQKPCITRLYRTKNQILPEPPWHLEWDLVARIMYSSWVGPTMTVIIEMIGRDLSFSQFGKMKKPKETD